MKAIEEIKSKLQVIGKEVKDIEYAKVILDNFLRKVLVFQVRNGVVSIENETEYDSGYGAQELYGAIVFKDGSWLERTEYDGSESWKYKRTPTVKEVFNLIV